MDYYYTDASNQTRGPVSEAELQELAASGQVTPATMVAAVGSQQWVPVTTVLPNLGITPQIATTPGAAAPTEPLAIWSLVLSLVGLMCCGFFASVPAIICGHMALSAINKKTYVQGKGLAVAGLVIGYIATVGWLIYVAIVGIAAIVQNH